MNFENLVKAMIKPLKWQESPRRIDAFFSEHYSVSKDAHDLDDDLYYLEIQDQEGETPYASLALAQAAADDHNRAQIMAALTEIMDFDPEQAFKERYYPNAIATFNADGWWAVKRTPNSEPIAHGKTEFEVWCKALVNLENQIT
jgi:hypothetical protein